VVAAAKHPRIVSVRSRRAAQTGWLVAACLIATIGLLLAWGVENNRGDADAVHSLLAILLYVAVAAGLWRATVTVGRAVGLARAAARERAVLVTTFAALIGGPVGIAVLLLLTFDPQ